MIELTEKEQKLKDYIIKTEHSTDCAASVFWSMNPDTIQPFMVENGMYNGKTEKQKLEMLERVLNNIEMEKKKPSIIDEIVENEKDWIEQIKDNWIKGNKSEAETLCSTLCNSYGITQFSEEGKSLSSYLSSYIDSFLNSNNGEWAIIERYPGYKMKEDGTVIRMRDKKLIPIKNNKVMLRKDGKYVSENIAGLIGETFYNQKENEIDDILSEFEVSSEI